MEERETKQEFINNMDQQLQLYQLIDQADYTPINDITGKLKIILLNSTIKTFPKITKKEYIKKRNKVCSEWYDRDCSMSRQNYHRTLYMHNEDRMDDAYENKF